MRREYKYSCAGNVQIWRDIATLRQAKTRAAVLAGRQAFTIEESAAGLVQRRYVSEGYISR